VARIGILGGTFNPPHAGHLALARCAREQLGLERVLLMPACIAPNKPAGAEDPGPEHRLEMCRSAVGDELGLEASPIEIERGGVSYTVETLRLIHETQPDWTLTLILGADTARTLPSWRDPARLAELAELAVADRDELDAQEVRETLAGLRPAPRVRTLRMQRIEVSSSRVRELVASGRPVRNLVGEAVAEYIAEHGLYRAPGRSATIGGQT
jgi:nicotinate-nucleotide adenylyltransferase